MTPAEEEPRVVAGRYRLVKMINWGGMGVVWRAEDLLIAREVAVKELRAPVGCSAPEWQEFSERALREARATGRVAHPGIAAIYDVVSSPAGENAIYLIMELLDGLDLAQVIEQEGKLDEPRVTDIATQLLAALAAAHAEEVVHRDVKPGNIMVLADGTVKLVDFGIAHALGETRMTYNAVIGTRAFMAPELFGTGEITPAVDLWSLGVTLFAAVTGSSPFLRDSEAATLSALLFDDVPAPKCKSPLKETITALLTRDPARRATIGAARDLLAGRQLKATVKIGAAVEVKPPASRKPTSGQGAGWSVVVVLAAVLLCFPQVRDKIGDLFESSRSNPAPSRIPSAGPSITRPAPSSTYVPPSRTTTSESPTTTPFDPDSLDSVAKDDTPFTTGALLSTSFTDNKKVNYTYRAGGVHDCVLQGMSDVVKQILNRAQCSRQVYGNFIDTGNHVLVSVQVYAFPTKDAAETVYQALDAQKTLDFSMWCPATGIGSSACDGDYHHATGSIYIRRSHRYVMSAYAVYVNLGRDPSVKPWLDAAASEAVSSAGPQNHR